LLRTLQQALTRLPTLTPLAEELVACLAADGFSSVADAVGADHRAPPKKGRK
jgi:hypothetical protein